MKRKIMGLALGAIAAALLVSCGHRYDVSGTWEGGAGKTVYLYAEGEEQPDSLTVFDSAAVAEDGSFSMKGGLDYPKKMVFFYAGKKKPVFAGAEPLTVNITARDTLKDRDGNQLYDCKITGTKEQKVLEDGADFELSNALLELGSMMMLSKAYEGGKQSYIDSVTVGIEMMKENFNKSIREYLDTTRDNVASTYFIRDFMLKNRAIGEARSSYDSLSAAVKATPQGKDLYERIEYASRTNVGGIPDDFELPTPDGGTFSLGELKGHYVILDFWASWCKPCLAEMPNVKAIYENTILTVWKSSASQWMKTATNGRLP